MRQIFLKNRKILHFFIFRLGFGKTTKDCNADTIQVGIYKSWTDNGFFPLLSKCNNVFDMRYVVNLSEKKMWDLQKIQQRFSPFLIFILVLCPLTTPQSSSITCVCPPFCMKIYSPPPSSFYWMYTSLKTKELRSSARNQLILQTQVFLPSLTSFSKRTSGRGI